MEQQTCLFIGRFQPFHKGHLLVLQGMVKVCSRVVIAIGSCDTCGDDENPFTAEQRRDMIQAALQDVDIIPQFDINFIEVPDMDSDEEWTKHVLEAAGDVHTLWTGNPDVITCFEGSGINIQEIKEVPGISGTEIRRLRKEGGDWKSMVPSAVADAISKIG